jgi:DNA repair protein RadA/Sms
MSKAKSVYVCRNCGADSPKWIGRCPSCNEWNSYVEEVVTRPKGGVVQFASREAARPALIDEIISDPEKRMLTGIGELDRLLGGGLVKGSVILLGGEPGIGKSTLALQLAMKLSGKTVLYVSGEESEQQIKMRAERITGSNNLCYVLSETDLGNILTHATHLKPEQ